MSSAKSDADTEFFARFLDDYFAECDEHLTLIRRFLLALEPYVNQSSVDRSLVDDLFRSFHSLKGISAMVGFLEAEQIAHQTESYLRHLREDQLSLTAEAWEALIAGAKMLERVVADHQAHAPATDIAPVLARLDNLLSGVSSGKPSSVTSNRTADPATLNRDESVRVASAIQRGLNLWRFEFIPSASLAQRGINVNSLRSRLQNIGELIHATPRVMEQGAIAFEFLVASSADEELFKAWRDDGLTYAAFDAESVPESPDGDQMKGSESSPPRAPSTVVRVDLGRLDDLMRMVGEATISRSRLDDQLRHLEGSIPAAQWRPLQDINLAMERELRSLREGVMRVRMVPISEVFERMRFVVRDLAREHGKRINLELIGQETEIDKLLVERMMDPILHLVRNAISHGLETPAERSALGKPPEGKLTLRASTVAEMVQLEIEDDGRGIDAGHVAERAREVGLIDPGGLSEPPLLDLICAPGLSTRQEADRAAGRGIGMAVVRQTVLSLGGSLSLDTEAGRGTRFKIELPLTLAIADALVVSVGEQRFAVPQSTVFEVIEIESSAVKVFERNEIVPNRDGVLPLIRLARIFGLKEKATHSFHAFVVGEGLSAVGVAVDKVLGQREIVVRAITDPLLHVPGIAGATELGDGQIVLILDPADLNRNAVTGNHHETRASQGVTG